jgi:hypothetical protein
MITDEPQKSTFRSGVEEDLEVMIRARYPVIYIVTWEEARVEQAIAEIAAKREKKVFTWSICRGIQPYGTSSQSQRIDEKTRDPEAALSDVIQLVDPAVYVFKDFHPYFCQPQVVRKVREVALSLKNSYKTLIIISPTMKLPMELEKEVSVIDFTLPSKEEIGERFHPGHQICNLIPFRSNNKSGQQEYRS